MVVVCLFFGVVKFFCFVVFYNIFGFIVLRYFYLKWFVFIYLRLCIVLYFDWKNKLNYVMRKIRCKILIINIDMLLFVWL